MAGRRLEKGGEGGIKKWPAHFGNRPPPPPDKYCNTPLGSVLPFIVSMKTTSGGGGLLQYLYGDEGGGSRRGPTMR